MQAPVDVTGFFTVMAALSASVQTFVEHVIKKHVLWLDDPKNGKRMEGLRHTVVHAIAFGVGGALAWSTGIAPLAYLGVTTAGMTGNVLVAGLLVSFGGSLFDEGLGAIRAFKKAQEEAKESGRVDARGAVDRRQPGVPVR
jgi:hypothetical protein